MPRQPTPCKSPSPAESDNWAPVTVVSFDYRVRRSSDGKEIVVSSARKVASLDPDGKAWLNQVRERG